jgi:hypothetical protein
LPVYVTLDLCSYPGKNLVFQLDGMLMHAAISFQVTSLHIGKKNCRFAAYMLALNLLDYGIKDILQAKGNTMAQAKTSFLKQTTWRLWPAKIRRWCSKNTILSGSAWRRLSPFAAVLAIPTQAAVLVHYLQPISGH